MAFIWVDELWGSIYEKYPPGLIEFGCMVFTQVVGFWIPGTIYLGIDLLFPNFSNRHKIQSERRQPSRAQIVHCIKHVGLNEIVGLSIQLALRTAFGFQYSVFRVERQLPGLWTVVSDIVYGSLAGEFVFYYIHRAFHHPLVYTKVHKQHHQFTAPISFAGQYAHPVEHIFANLVPVIVPLALRGANLVSATIFVLYEIWQAAADHSGYDFVKLPPTKFHDLHHEKFRVYFGTIGLMDWLHGTDKGVSVRPWLQEHPGMTYSRGNPGWDGMMDDDYDIEESMGTGSVEDICYLVGVVEAILFEVEKMVL